MEFISDKVSIDDTDERCSVVIEQRVHGWKRTLFITWFVFWSLCGVYFIMALALEPARETKLIVALFLVFWAYYAWKIGNALMWRLRGVEQWRIADGVLTVKDSINGYGKAKEYFVENITGFEVMDVDERSWKWQMSNSPWQIGGERVSFTYQGKTVALGKGLSASAANKVVKKVRRAIQRERKRT